MSRPATGKRLCPVCCGTDSELISRQEFLGVTQASLLSDYEVVVCAACGCGYADGIPKQSAFDAYYQDLSKYENPHRDGSESCYDTAAYEAVADLVQQAVPSPTARIVDIGCATGGLLAAFKRRGYHNLLGVDPSPACADIAGRIHQIRVVPGTLADLPAMDAAPEFVSLSGVLEHVRDVLPALAEVRARLRSDGRVHVGVPDATRFAEWPSAPFQHFSVEHINFFSPASLANLMSMAGFRQVFEQQLEHSKSHAMVEPVIHAVFERDDSAPRCWSADTQTRSALRLYVAQSERAQDAERLIVARLVEAQEAIVVWGTGTCTQRLLASTMLKRANIRAFVDSNPKYQGKELVGRPILAPIDLQTRSEAILISSWMYQQEIEEQITKVLKLRNKVIKVHVLSPQSGKGTAGTGD
jgi:SAM-dependent methyltransferase